MHQIWSWGVNDDGALGRITNGIPDPNAPDSFLEEDFLESQPMLLSSLADAKFRAVAVSAGDSISVALGSSGELRAWGTFKVRPFIRMDRAYIDHSGQTADGSRRFDTTSKIQFTPQAIPALSQVPFRSISCGVNHVLGLSTSGHVMAWGNWERGQLARRVIERRIGNALVPERLRLRNIVLVAAGENHSFAVDVQGKVFAWGLNSHGQTGVSEDMGGTEHVLWQPTEVTALHPDVLGRGRRVVQIAAAEHHTLFLVNDGSVYSCGRCDSGQLGLGAGHPLMLKSASHIAALEAEARRNGELPRLPDQTIRQPTLIPFDDDMSSPPSDPIAHISATLRHNLAVSRSGRVYSWGLGLSSQLGLGKDVSQAEVPTLLTAEVFQGRNAVAASAGGLHCLVAVCRQA